MIAKPRFDGEWVRLGELISKAPIERCGSREYPVYSMTMRDGIVEQAGRFKKAIASKDTSSYKVVKKNQLVVGFPIDEGVIYVQNHDAPGIMSPAYNVWDFDCNRVDPAYLELALHGPRSMAHYADKMRGTTARRRTLTADGLCNLEIPLPSIDEQIRVVHVLDGVRSLIKGANRQIAELDTLAKSRFVEMFGSCTRCVSLADVCCFRSGKTLPKSNEMPSGDYLYAKVGDLNLPGNERVIKSSRSYVNADVAKNLIPEGAVVFPKRGGAISTNKKRVTARDCCLDLNLMAVIPGEQICTEYLLAWFDQMDLAEIANGSAVPQINNKDLEPLIIPLPQMEAQQEFASFVAQVDKSRFVVQRQIGKLRTLYDSRAQIVQQPIAQMLWTQRAVVQP